ncbi:DHA2 family efflux MFS transporter permease subunit [Vibrio viridaestus]|uniref:DHA2 family efflux MFS transporter permease subunit n=2 Tax=Vibrio viridaestus TaxID=2487322 RepID=A0A3N9TJE5_9VIBR|nr:DHA2 family efflux MFS transporter permease subunit [Vibrio viridaestus]
MPQRLGAILTIALGITMAVLDGTIANVALPSIATDLNTSAGASIWIVNGYQLVITMTLLSLSSLGDIVGYRRIYKIGLALFSIMSLFCALSDSLLTLTIARILQGFGAAALMSVNTALIRLIYPRARLGRGLAINALVVAISTAAGPTVAAAILAVTSWQWLFAINVPLGIAAFIMAMKYLPQNEIKQKQRFDGLSALLNAITFGLFFIALTSFSHNVNPWVVAIELFVTLVIGSYFVRHQLKNPLPLLPVDLLRIPIFSLSLCTSICSFCAQMLAMVSIPFYFQRTLGLSETETGLLLTPWPLATMVLAPISGRLVERIHAGLLGSAGMVLFSAGLFALSQLTPNSGYITITIWMILCGAGFGLFQSPNNLTIISSAPKHRSGGASGMLGTARLVGQTTGTAIVALLFNMFTENGTHYSLVVASLFAIIAAVVSGLRWKTK